MSDYDLEITGEVTIIPCARVDNTHGCWPILIMGPTGAGKSTFIEALAGAGQSLSISKDQLAGFTQEVLCYELMNAYVTSPSEVSTYPAYLIDTPGFSDSKISEMEIINKVKGWIKNQRIDGIHNILYLIPITDTRVTGSRRRTIKMLQSLLRTGSASNVTIVTTMWDRVSNAKAKERAEAHFVQLRDDIWKDLVGKGANVMRFQNDHTSAIDVVRVTVESSREWIPLGDKPISVGSPSAPFLYQELLDRISNSRHEIESLRFDQIQLVAHPDPHLELWVVPRLHEVKQDLAKFLGQLVKFGDPPLGFDKTIPQQVVYQILLDRVSEDQEYQQALQAVLVPLQAQPRPNTIRISTLHVHLKETEAKLRMSAGEVVKFGKPPKGFEDIVFPLRMLSPKNRARQGLHQVANFFIRLISRKR